MSDLFADEGDSLFAKKPKEKPKKLAVTNIKPIVPKPRPEAKPAEIQINATPQIQQPAPKPAPVEVNIVKPEPKPVIQQPVQQPIQQQPEIEEEEIEEIIIPDTTTITDVMNAFDEKFDAVLRQINKIPTKTSKIHQTLYNSNDTLNKLTDLIHNSERKDRKLQELQYKLNSQKAVESNPYSDAIATKMEELAAFQARHESCLADINYIKQYEEKLQKQVQSIDKQIDSQIIRLKEQMNREFELSNKNLLSEINDLKNTMKEYDSQKSEIISKIKAVAQDSALVKAGGNAEVEKMKQKIAEHLKSVVSDMANDITEIVSSNFKPSTVYDSHKVVNAVKYALQNAADSILNPDEDDDEEEEEEED